jgi:hypothetical protein
MEGETRLEIEGWIISSSTNIAALVKLFTEWLDQQKPDGVEINNRRATPQAEQV